MKLNFVKLTTVVTVAFLFVFGIGTNNSASAAPADGTYEVNYQVLKAENNSASIADGYFQKPAKLIVENGVQTVQVTVTSANMVKSLTGPNGKATVVSNDTTNNVKVLKFTVNDISKEAQMKMHIVVDADEIQYDTEHGARFVFDAPKSSAGAATPTKQTDNENNGKATTTSNPKTGDETPILLFTLLLIGSGLIIARGVIVNKKA